MKARALLVGIVLAGCGGAAVVPPPAPPTVTAKADPDAKRAMDLFAHPEWIGTEVRIEIYGHYGHLGSGNALLLATEIVYLDPKRPDCR